MEEEENGNNAADEKLGNVCYIIKAERDDRGESDSIYKARMDQKKEKNYVYEWMKIVMRTRRSGRKNREQTEKGT